MQIEPQRRLDRELDRLRDQVLILGGETETALERAMYALVQRDTDVAHQVESADNQIDRLEMEIDRMCIDIIALRQPAARDLRFVISVAKLTPILERIADHAVNIARAAIHLNDEPQLRLGDQLEQMGERAAGMLRSALDAFTSSDSRGARAVIARDSEVDDLYGSFMDELLDLMANSPAATKPGARLMLAAKHLERIADYATDICELTVYMVDGEYIKHRN